MVKVNDMDRYLQGYRQGYKDLAKLIQLDEALREYVGILATEPAEDLIPIKQVYHDIRRMLGDDV